jgi:hypothetical protein
MRIDQNGKVGIGTISPSNLLHVYSTTSQGGITIDGPQGVGQSLRYGGGNGGEVGLSQGGDFNNLAGAGDTLMQADAGKLTLNNTVNQPITFNVGPNSGALAEAMRVSASGYVGIGTSSPVLPLEVAGNIYSNSSNSDPGLWIRKGDAAVTNLNWAVLNTGVSTANRLSFGNNSTPVFSGLNEKMVILTNGNVGIGTISPNHPLEVQGVTSYGIAKIIGSGTNAESAIGYRSSNIAEGASGDWVQGANLNGSNNGSFSLFNGGTSSITLTMLTNGNLGVGVISPSYQLQLSADSAAKPGTSTWTIASDVRLKDIRAPFSRGLDAMEGIDPIYFRYKKNNPLDLPSDKEFVGIRAQDAQKSVPEAVSTDEKGFLHVTNDAIIWTMFNSVKELYHRWLNDSAELHTRLASVEAENNKIKVENQALKLRLDQQEKDLAAIKQKLGM